MLLMLYLIAITAEAMTGALSAGRRGMDWFGVVLIACVTALGGGSVRDVRIPRHLDTQPTIIWTLIPSSLGHLPHVHLDRQSER
ncbi:trimeric intracellular cation channel family protein, partial [Pseudomonas syringae]